MINGNPSIDISKAEDNRLHYSTSCANFQLAEVTVFLSNCKIEICFGTNATSDSKHATNDTSNSKAEHALIAQRCSLQMPNFLLCDCHRKEISTDDWALKRRKPT